MPLVGGSPVPPQGEQGGFITRLGRLSTEPLTGAGSPVVSNHPYASAVHSTGGPYANGGMPGRQDSYGALNAGAGSYPRNSGVAVNTTGMGPTAQLSNVRARGGEMGVASTPGFDGMQRVEEEEPKRKGLLDILLCRCG